MNGNDYLEIEEAHTTQIYDDYVKELEYDRIPREFIIQWIDKYLEGE